ncbi:MAG: IPExxxVDY family protein [Bacteroidales bacterium]|nr:IPExxxVDY family protein [Bacteroidales bacterium]MDD3010768.1 IPExxxVDY family protein [Bacteroidales bacterium]MDD3961254.1 IPExxxVDY family protein [Bacteroidales bacterium]MDY0285627.1 IPExxxVDY family protein [Bacteroidales bacterium]
MPKRSLRPDPVDFKDFTFLGIVGKMPDYKMAYSLNKAAALRWQRVDDLSVFSPEHSIQCVLFFYYDALFRIKYFLIKNINESGILLPGLKNVDYLLLVEGFTNHSAQEDLLNYLRSAHGVMAVLRISPETVKEAKYILEDLEIHMIEHFNLALQ